MTWSEFSNKFHDEHPELYGRVLVKKRVTMIVDIDTHSDATEEEILQMAINEVVLPEGSGKFFIQDIKETE